MSACARAIGRFSYPPMKVGIFITLIGASLASFGAPLKVGSPRVEHRVNPVGVSSSPRFSWHLISEERSKRQIGYQILAASKKELLSEDKADLWNSSAVKSGHRKLILWKGKELKDGQTVFWKVRVTDESKEVGEWSEVAQFTVGTESTLDQPVRISGFESSSPELNKLYQDSITILEKRLSAFAKGEITALGDGADLQLSAREYLYHFDSVSHLSQWIRLMDAGRTKEGFFPVQPGSKNFGSVSSDAAITVHYPVWRMGGDDAFVKSRWTIFEEYMMAREKADQKFEGHKWSGYSARDVTPEFLDLTNLGYTTRLIRFLSTPAQEPLNVIRFKDFAARIRASFKEQYLTEEFSLKTPSQTAQLLALRCGVLPENKKEQKIPEYQETIIKNLLASLKKDGPQVGPIGAHFLLQVLPLIGAQDEAIRLVLDLTEEQRSTFLGKGTTEWMMSQLAGIDAASRGFDEVRIAPRIPASDSIKWVKAHHDSVAGRIGSRWEKLEGGGLKLEISIPAGIVSRVLLPIKKGQSITESGKDINVAGKKGKDTEAEGVTILGQSDTFVSLITQSGDYSFEIR